MRIRTSSSCLLCAAVAAAGCVFASPALAARTPSPVNPSFAPKLGKVTSKSGTGVARKHVLSSSPTKGKKLANASKVKVVLRA